MAGTVDLTVPRHALAAELTPLLPADWRIIPYQKNLDTLSTPVVMLKQSAITRLAEAPAAVHSIEFVVTVVSPLTDQAKAEDQLDDNVNALIHAIDALGILWTRAEKAMFTDIYICWDITLSVTSTKE